ncbi:MAG: class E sortase [Actinobacteria bacterium]|nr:class E sortase [Actinomycetota bacterium]
MSLILVGVGLALTATFFLGSPFPDQEADAAAVEAKQPAVPAISPKKPAGVEEEKPKERRAVLKVPEDKTLRITVPKMSRVRNSPIPYAGGTDETAFRNNAGVHLRGTGSPWHRQANVYVAGHRLGYVGTPSWLAFWDLNEVDVGDKIYVTDSMDRRYVYKVFKDFVVDPKDVFVTRPLEGRNILTLQTCTLPDYSRRLIIQAEKVVEPVASDVQGDDR